MSESKCVLITGCSVSGIAYKLALESQRYSYRILATAYNAIKIKHLAELKEVTLLALDITSDPSILRRTVTLATWRLMAKMAGQVDQNPTAGAKGLAGR